jgi:hypothetical protein
LGGSWRIDHFVSPEALRWIPWGVHLLWLPPPAFDIAPSNQVLGAVRFASSILPRRLESSDLEQGERFRTSDRLIMAGRMLRPPRAHRVGCLAPAASA